MNSNALNSTRGIFVISFAYKDENVVIRLDRESDRRGRDGGSRRHRRGWRRWFHCVRFTTAPTCKPAVSRGTLRRCR
ncbi:hypothetical protein HanXRQr2_Chr09g0408611 [Helianthus annuus]|uniref:Uncharacterized protein n=1 Tax=Helianthus annuus TaxID=4232 RepID=A0A9K3NA97_HELAN|nr:hypothetical protein HanXRQr2_Chr09g0408611 [Helianthus annuus]KAJ0894941.1 hypothetical protein HanPSC8_Chr09g0394591 [Helianthus annuus]